MHGFEIDVVALIYCDFRALQAEPRTHLPAERLYTHFPNQNSLQGNTCKTMHVFAKHICNRAHDVGLRRIRKICWTVFSLFRVAKLTMAKLIATLSHHPKAYLQYGAPEKASYNWDCGRHAP